jgi:hypothetical protein
MKKTIAIIGASANREKFGNKAVRAYLSQDWKVFPLNPVEEKIEGLKCYKSITAVPEKPSKVSIYLPPKVTISIIPELKNSGIKEVILNPGAESEELIEALKKSGIKPLLFCSIRAIGIDPDSL